MAKNNNNLELSTVKQICDTLENVVVHSIGPRGRKCLLATETGQVIISNDGNTVLRKLHFSHPVARLVIDSMTRMVNFTGDGSKTFILYVSQLITEIFKFEHRGKIERRNVYITALQRIKQEIIKNLHLYIESKISDTFQHLSPELLQSIMKTCLSNCFPPRLVDHFVMLLCDVIFSDQQGHQNVMLHLQNIVDNLDQICIKIPNLPYIESKTISPFIIQRQFSTYSNGHISELVKFVICVFPIIGHEKNIETREIIRLRSEETMVEFLTNHHLLLGKFVERCVLHDINLVLCACQVSDPALRLFESHKISVIQYVPEEDCDWLVKCLKLIPCTNILENLRDEMFFHAKSCKALIINGRQCAQIDFGNDSCLPKMLLLCAPTDGLCNQVFICLLKCLKSLVTCFSYDIATDQKCDGNVLTIGKIAVIGGGGTFEFLASEFIEEYSSQHPDVKFLCKILSTSLLQLPKVLFCNNSQTKHIDLKQYLLSLAEIEKSRRYCKYLGFNRNGQVSNLFTDGILEVVPTKIHIFLSVLDLVQQLLRVDCIVGVKKIAHDDT